MARKFFYITAGMFLLALAYHFGANTATAQTPGASIVGAFADNCNGLIVVTTNGDVFVRPNQVCANTFNGAPVFAGNFWAGGVTESVKTSWGQVKARYRTTPGMTVTPGADNK